MLMFGPLRVSRKSLPRVTPPESLCLPPPHKPDDGAAGARQCMAHVHVPRATTWHHGGDAGTSAGNNDVGPPIRNKKYHTEHDDVVFSSILPGTQ